MHTRKNVWLSWLLVVALIAPLLVVSPASTAPQVVIDAAGGFLFPFEGVKQTPQVDHDTPSHDGNEIDFAGSFDVLAPKDGVVIFEDDSFDNTYSGDCTGKDAEGKSLRGKNAAGANYLVLGHGPKVNGKYAVYSTYLHLQHNSIPSGLTAGSRVKVGQKIGISGKTGWSTNDHLHFHVTYAEPTRSEKDVVTCQNTGKTKRLWLNYPVANSNPIGFEENGNVWPLLDGKKPTATVYLTLPPSRNQRDMATNVCNPETDNIILYQHVGYGGECKVIPMGQTVTDMTAAGKPLLVSSVAVKKNCLVTLYDSTDTVHANQMRLPINTNSLATPNQFFNDLTKAVITPSGCTLADLPPDFVWLAIGGADIPTTPDWLQDFSISEKLPLEVRIHTQVQWTNDFDAFRVCMDGQNCQETSATEQTYTWNTYNWPDGEYTFTVQYRRHSDNQNWETALEYTSNYYLSPVRGLFANCGSGANGASLTSGSDCTVVTSNVRELDEIEWADRPNLTVSVEGPVEAWVYDGPDYQGQPRIIKSGESEAVGNNISSVEIKPLAPPPPPVPTEPFTADANTLHLWHFDENSGSTVNDSVGSRHGTISNGTWTDGKFGSGLSFPNPPDGRSVTFGTMDVCPLTYETWMKRQPLGNGMGRVAGQEGGGGNSGQNKWLFYFNELIPTLQIFTPNGGSQVFGSQVVSDYDWHYFMVTFDCTSHAGKLYMDNELIAELTLPEAWSPGATTLEMGSTEGIYRCNCFMDEVRISNTVRVPVVPEPDPDPTPTPTPSPTPEPLNNGVELLAAPVHLEGDDGSDGLDWVVPDNTLNGRNMVRVMLDMHGLYPLGGDASALAFSQGPWQYVGLSDYTQGGVHGIQTVHIPLSDFMDLDPSQPMEDVHLRFWYGGPFEVDIYSVYAYTAGNPDTNLALGREATASSIEDIGMEADKAVDGDLNTRWASLESDPEWMMIDLGHEYNITSMRLVWEPAYATMYQVQTSHDGIGWTTVYSTNTGDGDIDYLSDLNTSGRYVKIYGSERATQWCYSLWEVEIYGDNAVVYPPPAPEGLELLNAPITISGEDGSTEYHQDIPAFALAGMTHVRVTLDLNGLSLYPGDASALAFSQWDWKYVGLAAYVQNGLDGEQTVVIPLADFMDLVPDDEVGDMHMRIWHPNQFNVDVMSIYAFHQD